MIDLLCYVNVNIVTIELHNFHLFIHTDCFYSTRVFQALSVSDLHIWQRLRGMASTQLNKWIISMELQKKTTLHIYVDLYWTLPALFSTLNQVPSKKNTQGWTKIHSSDSATAASWRIAKNIQLCPFYIFREPSPLHTEHLIATNTSYPLKAHTVG